MKISPTPTPQQAPSSDVLNFKVKYMKKAKDTCIPPGYPNAHASEKDEYEHHKYI